MTTLDYAKVFETRIRPRRLRRLLFGAAALVVAAIPLAYVGLLRLG